MTEEHTAKIIKTYQYRVEEARYSRRVEMAEIEKAIAAAKAKHNGFLGDLGLKLLP